MCNHQCLSPSRLFGSTKVANKRAPYSPINDEFFTHALALAEILPFQRNSDFRCVSAESFLFVVTSIYSQVQNENG